MDAQQAIDLSREAIRTCLMIGGPILALSLVIGLLLGVVQAMTQIQDQAVSFVPKALLVMVGIAMGLPWLSDRMLEFSHDMFSKPQMMAATFSTEATSLKFAPVETTVDRTAALPAGRQLFPVAWPGVKQISPQEIAPAVRDSLESNDGGTVTQPASPFQLPHYRFTRRPTDDLEG